MHRKAVERFAEQEVRLRLEAALSPPHPVIVPKACRQLRGESALYDQEWMARLNTFTDLGPAIQGLRSSSSSQPPEETEVEPPPNPWADLH